MLAGGANYSKLKTNLRLSVNRLKLLEKKKSELAQKSRREIADYLSNGKTERARIRVEHIIREDYLVEAMEVVEMYCDLLLARFGLIQQMKTLDDGLAEAISSIIWISPRLQTDVPELKIIGEQLTAKYGKPYALACRENAVSTVSEKLMHKMNIQAPPKILVERYLVEIAKSHNIEYEPDPDVMRERDLSNAEAMLIDLGNEKPPFDGASGGGEGGGGGFFDRPIGFRASIVQPSLRPESPQPFNYPPPQKPPHGIAFPPPVPSVPPSAPYPSLELLDPKAAEAAVGYVPEKPPRAVDDTPAPSYDSVVNQPPYPPASYPPAAQKQQPQPKPMPAPRGAAVHDTLPELPSVPDASFPPLDEPSGGGADDIDFDDLTRRFEALKKKK